MLVAALLVAALVVMNEAAAALPIVLARVRVAFNLTHHPGP
jgi:hypothetical protein